MIDSFKLFIWRLRNQVGVVGQYKGQEGIDDWSWISVIIFLGLPYLGVMIYSFRVLFWS